MEGFNTTVALLHGAAWCFSVKITHICIAYQRMQAVNMCSPSFTPCSLVASWIVSWWEQTCEHISKAGLSCNCDKFLTQSVALRCIPVQDKKDDQLSAPSLSERTHPYLRGLRMQLFLGLMLLPVMLHWTGCVCWMQINDTLGLHSYNAGWHFPFWSRADSWWNQRLLLLRDYKKNIINTDAYICLWILILNVEPSFSSCNKLI